MNRSLTRPTVHRAVRGHCPGGHHLSVALRAFARSLRARRQLIRLAPHLFDPAVLAREEKRRAEQAIRDVEISAALEAVYGPGTTEKLRRDREQQDAWNQPRLAPATARAIERWSTERELWLSIGTAALGQYEEHAHHRLPGLDRIAALLDMSSRLGRAACGLPLDGKVPPEPEPLYHDGLTFEQRIEKAFGKRDIQPVTLTFSAPPRLRGTVGTARRAVRAQRWVMCPTTIQFRVFSPWSPAIPPATLRGLRLFVVPGFGLRGRASGFVCVGVYSWFSAHR